MLAWSGEETRAKVASIELCYRRAGDLGAPVLVLLGGLGMQLISWPEELLEVFCDKGFQVLVYDHRDCGHSTYFDDAGLPDLLAALRGDDSKLAYRLGDLAADVVGLLNELEIDKAHLFGTSMGGMVAQVIAIEHAARVASLCSALSTTGAKGVGKTANEALNVLLRPGAKSPEQAVAQWLEAWRVTRSPAYSYDEDYEVARAVAAFERANHPQGSARQLAAVLAASDRTASLASVRAPTLVLHGSADVLIDVSGGYATAAAIPGARLEVIEGMGHDLPKACWERISQAVLDNAERLDRG